MFEDDLSEIHGPVSTFLPAGDVDITPISRDAKAFFDANGYLSGIRLLSDAQIDRLREELADLMTGKYANDHRLYEYNANESTDPARVLFHALGAWRMARAFHDLIFHRTLAKACMALLSGPVRFWHDQVFVKPPRDGGVVAWHQDYSYWTRTKPVAHLTCWIALDDSTVENGCVHYIPGSHRWDLLPRDQLAGDMDSVLSRLSEEQRAVFRPVPIELRAGEASFHHPMTLHGSFENRSDRPRRAAVVNVFRDGVMSDTDAPLLDGVPVIPRGAKIQGRFFPLISS